MADGSSQYMLASSQPYSCERFQDTHAHTLDSLRTDLQPEGNPEAGKNQGEETASNGEEKEIPRWLITVRSIDQPISITLLNLTPSPNLKKYDPSRVYRTEKRAVINVQRRK